MMRVGSMTRARRIARALLVMACLSVISAGAWAAVRKQGTWPEQDRVVSLEARGVSRAEALQKLADAAGWSIVVHAPPGDPVDVRVKNQPASTVLGMLLEDGDYVANRQGDLISISRAAAASQEAPAPEAAPVAPAAPAAPSAAPAPVQSAFAEAAKAASADDSERGEDRVVTGGNLKIDTGEVVHDVVTLGGSLDVLGTVTGDVVVTGGSVRVREGARVQGDITAMGGSVDVEEGARIDGEVAVIGGTVHRRDSSKPDVHVSLSSHGKPKVRLEAPAAEGLLHRVGAAITRTALLFVFGAVLIALAGGKMESLSAEVAARPMRSFALGIVGALASAVLLVALCVTLIGIPVAVVASVLGVVAVYGGICAVLVTVGGALLGHKTRNPYVHLALGCLLFLVVGALPYLGGLVTAVTVMIGIGCLVATRGAGLFVSRRNGNGGGPYRTAAV